MSDLKVNVAGIEMKNPVLTASGTCGYGRELSGYFNLSELGGAMVKGTTLEPRSGNPTPRIAETPAGVINSVGLQNPGVDKVLTTELPWITRHDLAVIVNIAGNSPKEYAKVAEAISTFPKVHGIEVNISCPNVKAGGLAFGADPKAAAEVTAAVRKATNLPLIIKLSPNVTDITEIARACEAAGADAVSMINTIMAMEINIETRKPIIANRIGGLSGPCVRPIAVRMIWQTAQAVKIPIIGMGGVYSGDDAIQMMMAGASAVAIGSATMVDPRAPIRIRDEINDWLDEHNIASVREIIGAAL